MMSSLALSMGLGLLSSLVSGIGIVGVVAIVAGVLLFGGLRQFASTPRGLLVIGGVLAAALAVTWLLPRLGLAGSRSGMGGQGREATAEERLAAEHAAEKKRWKKWNEGAEKEVDHAAAQMAMAAGAMGGVSVPMMPMPHIQSPTIRPPNFGAHGPAIGAGPAGSKSVVMSSSAAPAAAGSAAPPAMASPAPMDPQPMTHHVAIASLDARDIANASKTNAGSTPKTKDAGASASSPQALQKGAVTGSTPQALGALQKGAVTGGTPQALAAVGPSKGSVQGKATSPGGPGVNLTANDVHASATPPVGTNAPMTGGRGTGMSQHRQASQDGAMGQGMEQQGQSQHRPRPHRPRYQSTDGSAGGWTMDGSEYSRSHKRTPHGNTQVGSTAQQGQGAQRPRHHYQSTEQFVAPFLPDMYGNHHMGGHPTTGHPMTGNHPMMGGHSTGGAGTAHGGHAAQPQHHR